MQASLPLWSQNLIEGEPAMVGEVRAAKTPKRREILKCMAVMSN